MSKSSGKGGGTRGSRTKGAKGTGKRASAANLAATLLALAGAELAAAPARDADPRGAGRRDPGGVDPRNALPEQDLAAALQQPDPNATPADTSAGAAAETAAGGDHAAAQGEPELIGEAAGNAPAGDASAAASEAESGEATFAEAGNSNILLAQADLPAEAQKAAPSSGGGASGGAAANAGTAEAGAASGGAAGGAAGAAAAGVAAGTSLPALALVGGLAAAAGGGGGGGGDSGSSSGSAGSGGSGSTVATVIKSLRVVDPPVKDAEVFYDTNNNGKLDRDLVDPVTNKPLEAVGTTDANGFIQIEYTPVAGGKFIIRGGVDIVTGQKFGADDVVGVLKDNGNPSTSVVSPLSTLLALSDNISEADVKNLLGLDQSTNLATYDFYGELQKGGAGAAVASKALQLATLVDTVSKSASSLLSKDNTIDIGEKKNVSDAIASALKMASDQKTANGGTELGTAALSSLVTNVTVGSVVYLNSNPTGSLADKLTDFKTSYSAGKLESDISNLIDTSAGSNAAAAGVTRNLLTAIKNVAEQTADAFSGFDPNATGTNAAAVTAKLQTLSALSQTIDNTSSQLTSTGEVNAGSSVLLSYLQDTATLNQLASSTTLQSVVTGLLTSTTTTADNLGTLLGDKLATGGAATGVNAPPVATDDAASIAEDAANAITVTAADGVLKNDTDVDLASGATLKVSAVAGAAGSVGKPITTPYGSVQINQDGSYSYTLDSSKAAVQKLSVGQTVTDTVDYTVTDGSADSIATLRVRISGTNDVPVILSESALAILGSNSAVVKVGDTETFVTQVTEQRITSIALGDFNGDGMLDLVGGGGLDSRHIYLYQGRGDGTFEPAVSYIYETFSPLSIALGDVNGDKLADIVQMGYAGADIVVKVLPGKADGSFDLGALTQAQVSVPEGDIVLRDVNNDGRLDVIAGGSSGLNVLLADSNGGFLPNQKYMDGSYALSLALGDIDHDGNLDIVTSNGTHSGSSMVSVLWGKGDGTFLPAEQFYSGIAVSRDVALGDLDKDGKLEIVSAHNGKVGVLFHTSARDFSSAKTLDIPISSSRIGSTALVVGDFDGDGNLDIIAANPGDVSMLSGDGAGGFGAAQEISTIPLDQVSIALDSLTTVPQLAAAVTEDVAVQSGKLAAHGALRFNDADLLDAHTVEIAAKGTDAPLGTFTAKILTDTTGSSTGGRISWDYTVDNAKVQFLDAGKTKVESFEITLADGHGGTVTRQIDITINGADDVLTAVPDTPQIAEDAASSVLSGNVLTNDISSTGGFTKTVTGVSFGNVTGTVGQEIDTPYGRVTINKDGSYTYTLDNASRAVQGLGAKESVSEVFAYTVKDEVATSASTLTVTINGTNDAPVTQLPVHEGPLDIVMADGTAYFGDGQGDIERVYLLAGSNSLVAVGDIDGDGKLDVAVASTGSGVFSNTIKWVKGDDVWNPKESRQVSTLESGSNFLVKGMAVGDVTGDGKADVVVIGRDNTLDVDELRVYEADGNLTSKIFSPGSNLNLSDLALGDFNNDGVTDAAVVRSSSNAVDVLLGGSNLTKSSFNTFNTVGSGVRSIAVGDVNNDGNLDIVTGMSENPGSTSSQGVGELLGDGKGGFLTAKGFAFAGDYFSVALGDVNNDGKLDIVVARYESSGRVGIVQPALGDGMGGFNTAQVNDVRLVGGLNSDGFALGDFNQDGNLDFVYSVDSDLLLGTGDGQGNFAGRVVWATPGLGELTMVSLTKTSSPLLATLTEDAQVTAGKLAATGEIGFSDVDLKDTHEVTPTPVGTGTGAPLGTLTAKILTDTTGTGTGGRISWDYAVDNALVQSLGAGQSRTEHFDITVTDNNGGSSTQTVDIVIKGLNDAPQAKTDGLTVAEDGASVTVTGTNGVLANDTDADANAIKTVSTVTLGQVTVNAGTKITTAYGSLTINADGSYTYTLDNSKDAVQGLGANESVSEVVAYTMQDDKGATSASTLTIGINGTNDVPVFVTTRELGFAINSVDGLNGNRSVSVAVGETETFVTEPGTKIGSFVLGDVNSDGKLDLVALELGGSGHILVYQGNGDGTFASPIAYAPNFLSESPSAGVIALGDVAAASRPEPDLGAAGPQPQPDLVAADGSTIGVLRGNGDGSFEFLRPIFSEIGSNEDISDLALGDINRDGVLDIVASAGDSGLWVLLTDPQQGGFNAPLHLSSGDDAKAYAIALGDIDKDGHLDIVSFNAAGLDFTVFWGKDDGTFEPAQSFGAGLFSPQSVALGNLDNLGGLDIVTAGYDGIKVLLYKGNRDFAAAITVSADQFESVALGDFDSSGNLDIVTTFASHTTSHTNIDGEEVEVYEWDSGRVGVFPGNGAGGFGPAQIIDTSLMAPGKIVLGSFSTMSVAGAVTEDVAVKTGGKLAAHGALGFSDVDLKDVHTVKVVAKEGDTPLGTLTATILTDTTNSGTGGKISWDYTVDNAKVQYLGTGQTRVESFNITLDDGHGGTVTQKIDVTIKGADDVLTAVADTAASTLTEDVASAPLTGNVLANDILGTGGKSMTVSAVSVEDGTGSVANPVNTRYGEVTINADGTYTYTLDNAKDAVQALGAGETASDAITYTIQDDKGANSSSTLTFTITGVNDAPVIKTQSSETAGAITEDVDVAQSTQTLDVERDFLTFEDKDLNDSHLVTVTPTGTPLGTFELTAEGGFITQDGFFSVPWHYSVPNDAVQYLGEGEKKVESFTIKVDDQHLGVVTQTIDITLTGVNDAPAFATAPLDIVFANMLPAGYTEEDPTPLGNIGVLLGKGDGSFAAAKTVVPGTSGSSDIGDRPIGVVLGDINGDGNLDLVSISQKVGVVRVQLGDGAGGFGTVESYSTEEIAPISIALGDVNGDGKLDAVTANEELSVVSVLLNNGGGGFAKGTLVTISHDVENTTPAAVALADLNGDKRADIVVADAGLDTVHVVLANANGLDGFDDPVDYATGGRIAVAVALRDVNGDGLVDIITLNRESNDVSVLLAKTDAPSEFQQAQTFDSGGEGASSFALGDVDGDHDLDIVVANSASKTIGVRLGNGDGTFDAAPTIDMITVDIPDVGDTLYSLALGDVNGDGKLDIVMTDLSNQAFILQGKGNGGFDPAGKVGTGGELPGQIALGALTTPDGLTGAVTEDSAPTAQGKLTTSGVLAFNDVDLIDVHTARFAPIGTGTAAPLGTLSVHIDTDTTGKGSGGKLGWTYSVDNAAVQSLGANETKVESFNITIDDGHGGTATQQIDVTIIGQAEGPAVAAVDDSQSFNEYNVTGPVTGSVLENDTGTGIVVSAVNDDATKVGTPIITKYGSLTINADGSYTYTLDKSADSAVKKLALDEPATDSFSYIVTEAGGATARATLSFNITGANDVPVATNDTAKLAVSWSGHVTGNVRTNDTDVDTGDVLNVSAVAGGNANVGTSIETAYGTVTIHQDGHYDYSFDAPNHLTFPLGRSLVDSIAYEVSDEYSSASASLEIEIPTYGNSHVGNGTHLDTTYTGLKSLGLNVVNPSNVGAEGLFINLDGGTVSLGASGVQAIVDAAAADALPVFSDDNLDVTLRVSPDQVSDLIDILDGTPNSGHYDGSNAGARLAELGIDHIGLNASNLPQGTAPELHLSTSQLQAIKDAGLGFAPRDTIIGEFSGDVTAGQAGQLQTLATWALNNGVDALQAHLTDVQGHTLEQNAVVLPAAADVDLTPAAGATHLSTSFKGLTSIGVDSVVGFSGTLSVDLDDAHPGQPLSSQDVQAIVDAARDSKLPTFPDAADVTLRVTPEQVGSLVDILDGIAGNTRGETLSGIHIDHIGADISAPGASGELDLDASQLQAIRAAGLDFEQAATIAGSISDPNLSGPDIQALADWAVQSHVDDLTVTLSDARAAEMELAGGHLPAEANVDLTPAAGATHLSTSFKGLTSIGVDSVVGFSGTLSVDLDDAHPGQPLSSQDVQAIVDAAGAGHLPTFPDAADVTLRVTPEQVGSLVDILDGIAGHTGGETLSGIHIDHIGADISAPGASGELDLDASQLQAIRAAGLDFEQAATIAGSINDPNLSGPDIQALADWAVQSHVDDLTVTLSDARAAAMASAGEHLPEQAQVDLTPPPAGTHLATSFKGMVDVGVDSIIGLPAALNVDLTSDGHALGDAAAFISQLSHAPSLPNFETDQGQVVTLRVTQEQVTDLVDILDGNANGQYDGFDPVNHVPTGTDLYALGIHQIGDSILGAQGELHLSADQMQAIADAGLVFAPADRIIGDFSDDYSGSLTPDQAAQIGALATWGTLSGGVDEVHLSDAQAHDLAAFPAVMPPDAYVDVSSAGSATGTVLNTTLDDLAKLGVNSVTTPDRADIVDVKLGVPTDDAHVNADLDALLAHFKDANGIVAPIFQDADEVTLDLGNTVHINDVSAPILDGLKLLGVDTITGIDADFDGNPDHKSTTPPG